PVIAASLHWIICKLMSLPKPIYDTTRSRCWGFEFHPGGGCVQLQRHAGESTAYHEDILHGGDHESKHRLKTPPSDHRSSKVRVLYLLWVGTSSHHELPRRAAWHDFRLSLGSDA